ncbi:uncharacterized protein LOC131548164 isoform X4 [Onychostoma macrolepis]|uniref:Coiled-coil domain-containing protein 106 n=1 Tax=Onychostoma macrolepis TaxID=369639 RepID=A0A7J6CLB3_9TELE|nr:uncharacterized protein LOC131548164 isoform X4 [Onychostoma macrolepis]KAF4107966.1 hypothetical protein G5714_010725 [Onychostoma macrolepis]
MKERRLNMEDCLHTSSDSLAKLVKWAHSHGTICTLIPNLKHMLNEGSHGTLTALWGCSAGHAYHWPLNTTCKKANKERNQESRSINTDSMIQAVAVMQNTSERFLGSAAKNKGDSAPIHDSCDISNCSEPSEMDDNGDEYNSHLYDIVCESSATDEDGDSEFNHASNITPRKRLGKEPGTEDSTDLALKKIKQERGEDYYSVANPQMPSSSDGNRSTGGVTQSPKPNVQNRPSSRSSMSQKPSSVDGDSMAMSSSPLDSSPSSMIKPLRAAFHTTQNKMQVNSNPACSQSVATLPHAGRIDAMGVLHRDEYPRTSLSYGEASMGVNPEMDLLAAQALNTEARADNTVSPAVYEIERLKALLQAERSKNELMGETISSLKQDKELLQQELTKKAELICDFLQDQLRPDKRRTLSSSQMEAGSSHQIITSIPEEGAAFDSPALFDSFEEVELHPLDRQRTIKISSKRSRDGENTRVRMKNVVGVIARYMAALQEFRRSVSMKVAFDRVGVDRNTISRTAAIAELSLAAPEVFHALPPWDEKEETLAHYAVRCRQAMDDSIKAKIKSMKAKGELLPIVSK